MSKYFPLFWDKRQIKCLLTRIYLNIFAIFLKIPIVPLEISKIGIDFYYKGDTVIWLWPWRRGEDKRTYISLLGSGTGEFGDCKFSTLREMDIFWESFHKACQECNRRDKDLKEDEFL